MALTGGYTNNLVVTHFRSIFLSSLASPSSISAPRGNLRPWVVEASKQTTDRDESPMSFPFVDIGRIAVRGWRAPLRWPPL